MQTMKVTALQLRFLLLNVIIPKRTDDMDNMLPEQQSHFIQTNPEVGISKEDSETAIYILNKEV